MAQAQTVQPPDGPGRRQPRAAALGAALGGRRVAVGGLAVTLLGLAFIYPDYVSLRHQRGTFAALQRAAADPAGADRRLPVADARDPRPRSTAGAICTPRSGSPSAPRPARRKRGTGIGGDRTAGASADRAAGRRTRSSVCRASSRRRASPSGRSSASSAGPGACWPRCRRAGRCAAPSTPSFGQPPLALGAPTRSSTAGSTSALPIGTPVKAPAPGTVVFAGQHAGVRRHAHHRSRQRHQVALRPSLPAQRRRGPEGAARRHGRRSPAIPAAPPARTCTTRSRSRASRSIPTATSGRSRPRPWRSPPAEGGPRAVRPRGAS